MLTPTNRSKGVSKPQLIKKADKYFSLYVRYRDGEKRPDGWYAQCITCPVWKPIKEMQAGHFMSRRYHATRWEEENVNAQCVGCNMFKMGEQYKYSLELDKKYGDGTAKRLAEQAIELRKISRQELEEIIHDAKEAIKFYEKEV